VKAPFTGWITARNIQRGSLVGNATVGFTMVNTSVVKANFAVPDTSLKTIRLGQRLVLTLDALAHPVSGVVTAVSPEADPKTRVFSIEVSLPNRSDEIRPGMIGSLTLGAARENAPRLVAPLSAIVRAPAGGGSFAIYRVEDRDGKTYAIAQAVALGGTLGNSIEVTKGVTAGERIVALGGELLRNGQEVRILP
jgi:RND family efflux transporter MFP subunit